jgi:hypothetical protein
MVMDAELRSKVEELRKAYREAEEKSITLQAQVSENANLSEEDKKIMLAMYEQQEFKSRGMAEALDEIFFVVEGVFPPTTVMR